LQINLEIHYIGSSSLDFVRDGSAFFNTEEQHRENVN